MEMKQFDIDESRCYTCGSHDYEIKETDYRASVKVYTIRCTDCGDTWEIEEV